MAGGEIEFNYESNAIIINKLQRCQDILEELGEKNLDESSSEFFDAYKERLNLDLYPTLRADVQSISNLKTNMENIREVMIAVDNKLAKDMQEKQDNREQIISDIIEEGEE